MKREKEIERKFTVEPSARVPDLPADLTYGATQEFALDATYFDTPDLTLAAHRRTLRHRRGGDDDGWHLKLPPVHEARTEVRLAPDGQATTVPPQLRREVQELVGDKDLGPVVELLTTRRQTEIRSVEGVVAVLADDTVVARRLPDGEPQTWRELEVELTGSDVSVLDSITASWEQQGVRPSASVSKLAQALGAQNASVH